MEIEITRETPANNGANGHDNNGHLDHASIPNLKVVSGDLDAKIPDGPVADKWEKHKFEMKLVNPANKRKFNLIIVGTGLAGASAAATLAELGYNVQAFTYHDSPRRAHSIAAQGGINAAKNYQNDGDSVYRLFYDTVKGGDYRSREANVYRLAQVSVDIIDQCVAQGVPFAREYGGYLDNRSFGGAQVSRTFLRARANRSAIVAGRLPIDDAAGAARKREIAHAPRNVRFGDGGRRGARNFGAQPRHWRNRDARRRRGFALHRRLFQRLFSFDQCQILQRDGGVARAQKRRLFRQSVFHPDSPDLHSRERRLPIETDADVGIAAQRWPRVGSQSEVGDTRAPGDIPESERDYFLERRYPAFGNLVPRDVASRAAKLACDEGRGVGETGLAVYLDFADAIERLGAETVKARYGNLFHMYHHITAEDPYQVPMRIFPAVHYTMGGLWVDYNLMTTIPGLFALGECNFSDHGANRLGASALMQGLSDGYFVIPYTIGNYLAGNALPKVSTDRAEFKQAALDSQEKINKLLSVKGEKTALEFHRELGLIMWDHVGMGRTAEGLKEAIALISDLKHEFWRNVKVVGEANNLNQNLEHASRVADFIELAELMALDALNREESSGGHFREEHQTPEGEAKRDDENFSYVAAWEYNDGNMPVLHKEELVFEEVHPSQRSYK